MWQCLETFWVLGVGVQGEAMVAVKHPTTYRTVSHNGEFPTPLRHPAEVEKRWAGQGRSPSGSFPTCIFPLFIFGAHRLPLLLPVLWPLEGGFRQ